MNTALHDYTDKSTLKYYLLNVGEGLMTLIVFPDNTVMLFDCNLTNENCDNILGKMSEYIPEKFDNELLKCNKCIDIFVNSHRDEDHYRGLKKINEKFSIKTIWDSGQTGATTNSNDYNYYMYLRRSLKNKAEANLIVPVPSNNCFKYIAGTQIYCLATQEDFQENYAYEYAAKIQHTNSIVLMIKYGGRSLLLTGDSDWKSWKEKIVPNFSKYNLLKTNVLIASHHGSRSFFTDEKLNDVIDIEKNPNNTYVESIKLISPNITLISCGDYESAHHPNRDAKKLYELNTSFEQVYTTKEKGTICGFINNSGYFGVIPERFSINSNTNSSVGFNIKCMKIINGFETQVNIGDPVNIGCFLKFTVNTYGGFAEPYNSISVFWEVSNVGMYEHSEHHEIYYKNKTETDGLLFFRRELSYKGIHIMRCRIINKCKNYDMTKIFTVKGI